MIVNKFISSKDIINQVYRDTGSSEDLPIADMLSWIYEGLEIMNQPIQYIKKVTGHEANPNLNITNYKAPLPCDFHKLVQIAVNGMPARYSNSTFHHLLDGTCCGLQNSVDTADTFIDNFGNSFSPQASTLFSTSNIYDVVTFDINNDYLTLSIREGEVCIAYLAYPTDDEGWPMLPDDMSYRVAITKYLMMKLAYINWIKDATNNGKRAIFEHSEREWAWYVAQSTSKSKIPSLEEMESLKNQHLRLIDKINQHDTFFKTLGGKENRKKH